MAGGAVAAAGGSSRADQYKGGVTFYVIISCIVGACTGLVFGYGQYAILSLTHSQNLLQAPLQCWVLCQ